ncbi:SulP family inorganic anion transporter [Piscinibacter sp.]|uniref:SulP family inorganic anion transporter n=1 Tax=Piscinibacter sp. TaxID=1903157 RepID=UPI0039E536D4
MSATLPATAAVAAPSWWRETMAGSVGSIAVLAMVMTLGVLALAPLGAAGVPAGLQAGLVTAALGGLVYALLGRSVLPAAGPSSATALLLASLILTLRADPALAGDAGVPAVLALCGLALAASGVLQMLFGVLGLARLASYVPRPVLAGFMNGVALQVVLAQAPLLLGRPLGGGVGAAQPLAALLGLAAAALMLGLAWRWPRLPAALLVLLAGTALHQAVVHALPAAAPLLGGQVGALPAPTLAPSGALALLADAGTVLPLLHAHAAPLLLCALLLAGVGALETTMNALTLDRQCGTRHDPSRELVAMGATNLVLGLVGGVPATMNRTRATSVRVAGGQGWRALAAGSVVLGLLVVAGREALAWLSLPVMAGLMLAVAWSLVDRWSLQLLRRRGAGAADTGVTANLLLVTAVMLATLFFGLGAGVALGALLSLLIFVVRLNRSLIRARYTAAEQPSRRIRMPAVEAALRPLRQRVRVVELEGALFFGSGERLLAEADALPRGSVALLLDGSRLTTIDETGVQLLHDLHQRLAAQGVQLQVAGLRPALAALLAELPAQVSPDLDRALEAAEDRLLGGLALHGGAVALEDTPLLQGLPADGIGAVRRRLHTLRLSAGERLFEEGDDGDRLYLLLSGSVSVLSRTGADGRSRRYLSISPGMLLGETALLDGGGRTAGAVADTEAELVALDGAALAALEREHPALAARLYRRIAVHLSQRLRAAATTWRDVAD